MLSKKSKKNPKKTHIKRLAFSVCLKKKMLLAKGANYNWFVARSLEFTDKMFSIDLKKKKKKLNRLSASSTVGCSIPKLCSP